MKRSLNSKFAIIFTSVLFFLFVIILVVVQIVANAFTRNYVNDDVINNHKTMNSEITDVLTEINYGYTRMVQSDQFGGIFVGSEQQRQQAFLLTVNDSSLADYYVNVVLVADDIYCQNASFDDPKQSYVQTIIDGSSNALYYGEISALQNYLMVGRRGIYNNQIYAVIFYLDTSCFNHVCGLADQSLGYTMLLTTDYLILASSTGNNLGTTIMEKQHYPLQQSQVSRVTIEDKKSLVAVTSVSNIYSLDWYLVSVLDNDLLQKDFVVLSWILVSVAFVSLIVTVFFAIRLAKSTVKPINTLSNSISSVDFSNTSTLLKIGVDGDEIYELQRSYEEMLARLLRLMEQNNENMETQRRLEIDALTMQINPHFLYNTLDAIAWMAKIKKQPEIEKLVINLAKFFRISLHKGDKYVRICEETELIEHFLEIEKVRFPNAINYVCNIPEDIGMYKTIKLILQPIVENCIKHGFAGKQGVGTISISAKMQNDDILINVADDGCGFDIPSDFWVLKEDKPSGYGLYNVNKRIQLEYGEQYGLSISSQVGVGTTVTVKIKKSV